MFQLSIDEKEVVQILSSHADAPPQSNLGAPLQLQYLYFKKVIIDMSRTTIHVMVAQLLGLEVPTASFTKEW
jgi:hypothetical protein